MKTSPLNTQILALFLTLSPFFATISHVKAQSTSSISQESQPQSLDQFDLPLNSQPILPESLEQSEKPFEAENTRAVIGFDERTPVTSRKYPWSAIGRVEGIGINGVGYACTGTLLAPTIVLTNAHCVVNSKTGQVSRKIWFQPNLIYGVLDDDRDRAFVQKFYYGTDFTDFQGANPNDWALLQLDRPVGNKYGSLPWSSLPTRMLRQYRDQFALIGYSGDFPDDAPGETAGAHIGCSILGEENGLLIHNCDTNGGASGGPIIGIIDGKFQIIGLHAGALTYPDGKVVNYAVKMSRLDELFNR